MNKLSFDIEKSPGQVRVIEIANEILEEYKLSIVNEDRHEANFELLNRLGTDRVVLEDVYTGSKISTDAVSKQYLSWLTSITTQKANKDFRNFDFNRMIFAGSVKEQFDKDDDNFAYKGGACRPYVTARAIFTLANYGQMPSDGFEINYYVRSGITFVCEGNHRSLAYKLAGELDFPEKKVNCLDDVMHSEELNLALLDFERWFPRTRIADFAENIGNILNIHLELTHNPILLKYLEADFPKLGNRSIYIKILIIYVKIYHEILLEQSRLNVINFIRNIFKRRADYDSYEENVKTRMKKWLKENHE